MVKKALICFDHAWEVHNDFCVGVRHTKENAKECEDNLMKLTEQLEHAKFRLGAAQKALSQYEANVDSAWEKMQVNENYSDYEKDADDYDREFQYAMQDVLETTKQIKFLAKSAHRKARHTYKNSFSRCITSLGNLFSAREVEL